MRYLPLLLAPALFAQAPQAALETPLSAAERADALAVLGEAKAAFMKSLEGLSPAQRAWKAAPDRWSIDECAEHVAVTEGLLADSVVTKLLAGPREPGKREGIKLSDSKLVAMLQDRSHKATAPEAIAPKARFKTLEEAEAAFTKASGFLEASLRTSTADWRGRVSSHPMLGPLDAYQWTLLSAGHTLRHVQQIEEVKKAPGFPAK